MQKRIWTALIAVYIVWGSTYLAIRFAVETIPPFLMAGTRFLVSGLILYAWRRLAGDPLPTLRQWRSAIIVGLLLLLGGNGVVSWAEQHVPSGIAALMIATIPLWIVLIDALSGRRVKPDWKIVLGLLMGFGGIGLLVTSNGSLSPADGLDSMGLLALIVAALIWSLGSVYSRDADLPASSLVGTAIEMLGGAVGLFVAGTIAGEWRGLDLAAVSWPSLAGLLYLIGFGSLVGFVAYTWLLRSAPLSLVSTYAYVNPVVAIFLGAWLAGEQINARIIVSALIIISSVVVINLSRQTRAESHAEPTASPAD
jgi:drug/metabolite transporter (DMT)-like permease